ncbi:MAG: 4Fe-4S dicluster domain-containing protein [Bacteroidales bacterium]|nr:4Fe-4S dicluster domain-containing protein [Bacteroidales bacterium]
MLGKVNFKNKDFLIQNVLKSESEILEKEVKEKLGIIQRKNIDKPIITISINSTSIISGAHNLNKSINDYLIDRDIEADIVSVGSLGLCSIEPVISVQIPGKTQLFYKNVLPENIISILDGTFNNFIQEENVLGQLTDDILDPWEKVPFFNELAYFKNQQRLVLKNCGFINPESIEEYIAAGGYKSYYNVINKNTPEEVCDLIEASKLRGRGGQGYLTGKKWKIAYETPSAQKYLICNAGESDPGAFMERILIESDPHKVIEGIAISAYAIGVQKAFIYIETEYTLAIERIKNAIEQAKGFGLLGHDIMKSGYNLDIVIKRGAGAYVCGEETALISSLEGKRGKPHSKPPYPATNGLYNQPTIVNNVETLVNVPIIIEKGVDWYKSIGTEESKGTKVFSISGKVEYTCLVEVEMGTKLRDVIFRVAGGIKNEKRFKAVHIGGPSGGCLTEKHLDTLIDYESVMLTGISLGSASMVVLDEDNCIIDLVKYFMNFMQHESCGLCIPCREGTRRMYEILKSISKRPKDENGHTTLQRFKGVMQLESLAEILKDTSMCGLGKKASNPVLSTLKWFREEYEDHIFERKCDAGVCQELKTFEINIDACTGCTLCAKKCPTGAIFGTVKSKHFIVQDKCIGCGICFETCKFSAIVSK